MGAKRRLPVYPIRSTVRTLGTLAILIATLATIVTASQANAAVKGNAYTGEHFDWTIEWDDDVWDFDEEDNSGNSDFFVLTSRDEYTSSLSFLASTDLPDVEECVNQWAEIVLSSSGASDYEQLDNTDELGVRPGGGAAVFRYDVVGQTSTVATASYVQCFPLTEDVTIRVAVLTDLKPREATFASVEDVLQTLEESGSHNGTRESTDDRDDDPRLDEDDAESTRSVDESARGSFDSGRDDASNRPGNDDDRRDDEPVDTGIDGNEYVSPTYDFTVEWDEDVWSVATDEELIDEHPEEWALDRLVLDSNSATLFIEGRKDFDDGDMEACVEHDIDLVDRNGETSNLEIRENENGDPMEGETADGAFKVITVTMDDTNFSEYIECRPIDEGESVLVITLITKASDLEDAIPTMEDVVETIEF